MKVLTAPGECQWIGVPFDVSIKHVAEFYNAAAITYSLVPTLVIMITGIFGLISRRIFFLMFAIYGLVVVSINQIIAAGIGHPRPEASCCHTTGKKCSGMPSGHGDHYATFIIWISYEILTNPSLNHLKFRQRVPILIGPLLLWGPGFPSRVYINDHSWQQIGWGAFLGVILASCFILFLQCYFRPTGVWKLMDSKFAKKIHLVNDYVPSQQYHDPTHALSPRLIGGANHGVNDDDLEAPRSPY